eukprot:scaffold182405_cov29-Tisochrysis_lutea.AAC.1
MVASRISSSSMSSSACVSLAMSESTDPDAIVERAAERTCGRAQVRVILGSPPPRRGGVVWHAPVPFCGQRLHRAGRRQCRGGPPRGPRAPCGRHRPACLAKIGGRRAPNCRTVAAAGKD